MKRSVYVETSIVSYLGGWLHPKDLVVAANQRLTRDWWNGHRRLFDLFASAIVVDEAMKGDAARASERLLAIAEMTMLDVTPAARNLASDLLSQTRIPRKAEIDALHIAIAAIHGMDYLLTWNCTHIANGIILPQVYEVCRVSGYEPPLICAPQELFEESLDA
jgi:hypothetical protein